MSEAEFRTRLATLAAQLGEARARLAASDARNAAHQETAAELMTRYAVIEAQVAQHEATEASHGDSVSTLEQALRIWLKQLDRDQI